MSSRSHGKTNFQMSWLEDDHFKSWLKPGKLPSQAICTLCNSGLISVEKMGVSACHPMHKGKAQRKRKAAISSFMFIFSTKE